MRRKNNSLKYFIIFLLLSICASVGFIYLSPQFEQNKPKIYFQENIYWNLKDKLKLKLRDDSGIKFYKVTFKAGLTETILFKEVLQKSENEINLEVAAPKLDMFFKAQDVHIIVEVVDNSKWNFLEGNKVIKDYKVLIDKKRPLVEVIAHSLAITKGGSALAIVKIEDENLKEAYISFSSKERFELIPFYKKNYYISLLAWNVAVKEFTQVNLIAIDKANNKSIIKIPLYIRKLKKSSSNIRISESFIKNVSTKIIEQSSEEIPNDLVNIFVKQNRDIRAENIKTIRKVSLANMNRDFLSDFTIKPFKRLTNAATAGKYAQERSYYLDGRKIDSAWHLGIDWASVKKAPIKVSNPGMVIYNDYLGIYGNTVIIDHKLGLQTLYAHTSSSSVNLTDLVKENQKIANTGTSGAVLGDHLHFGVLIQGIEVNPLEWMDKNWIRTRITDVIKEAKEAIDTQ